MSKNEEIKSNEGNVAGFYSNKTALITGGSGFLGKVLIEKLLRSCPGLKQIFVLMRPKRNKQPQERFQELFKEPLFDLIRDNNQLLQKVVMVEGDISKENLGMNKEDLSKILKEVSVIFHVAATVKFDEPLKTAININLVGTKNVIELSRKLAQLVALVHVSTAYANCDKDEVDDHVYPVNMDPENLIQMAESLDQDTLQELKFKLIANKPNTYTYTKALAEWLLVKTARDLPVVICRPSIVTASWKEPFRGWIDNVNGPGGVVLATGKGILRSIICKPRCVGDLIPVDTVVNLLVSSAWFANLYQYKKLYGRSIVNGSVSEYTTKVEHLNDSTELTGQYLIQDQDLSNEITMKNSSEFKTSSDDIHENLATNNYFKHENLSKTKETTLVGQNKANRNQGYVIAKQSSNISTSDLISSGDNTGSVVSYCQHGIYDEKLSKFRDQNKLRLTAKNLPEEIADVPVFHCTSGSENPITWGRFAKFSIAALTIFPSISIYRCPSILMTNNKLLNWFYCILLHYLPAYIIDSVNGLFGFKSKLVKVCEKLDTMRDTLKTFSSNEWRFRSENLSILRNEIMSSEDKHVFDCDISCLNWSNYIADYVLGVRNFILKEPLNNLEKARRNFNYVYYRNLCLQIIFVALLLVLMCCFLI